MLFTSNSTSIQPPLNAATTSTATFTSVPPASASPTESTTVVPSSNNYRTTFQFQLNSLSATGIPTTIFTTSPPSNSPHTTITTRPGFKSTISSPTGCRHSTGHSYPSTSNSKLRAGNLPSTVLTSTHVWPHTSVFSASSVEGNMPSMNHISTPPLDYIRSHSFATSPNTPEHPLKQPSNCVAANILTWRSTPYDAWHPTSKSPDAVGHSTSSTKPSNTATSPHRSQTSLLPSHFWLTISSPSIVSNGSRPLSNSTNTWRFRFTSPPTVCPVPVTT